MRPATRQTHQLSLEAYYAEKAGGIGRRERMVLAALMSYGAGTDWDVAEWCGFEHRAAVQPRISELVRLGFLREIDAVVSPRTGKRVRRVAPTAQALAQFGPSPVPTTPAAPGGATASPACLTT